MAPKKSASAPAEKTQILRHRKKEKMCCSPFHAPKANSKQSVGQNEISVNTTKIYLHTPIHALKCGHMYAHLIKYKCVCVCVSWGLSMWLLSPPDAKLQLLWDPATHPPPQKKFHMPCLKLEFNSCFDFCNAHSKRGVQWTLRKWHPQNLGLNGRSGTHRLLASI